LSGTICRGARQRGVRSEAEDRAQGCARQSHPLRHNLKGATQFRVTPFFLMPYSNPRSIKRGFEQIVWNNLSRSASARSPQRSGGSGAGMRPTIPPSPPQLKGGHPIPGDPLFSNAVFEPTVHKKGVNPCRGARQRGVCARQSLRHNLKPPNSGYSNPRSIKRGFEQIVWNNLSRSASARSPQRSGGSGAGMRPTIPPSPPQLKGGHPIPGDPLFSNAVFEPTVHKKGVRTDCLEQSVAERVSAESAAKRRIGRRDAPDNPTLSAILKRDEDSPGGFLS
jgi:hypothetical protein